MCEIEGTFIALHNCKNIEERKECTTCKGKNETKEYYNEFKYSNILCLADCRKKGSSCFNGGYEFELLNKEAHDENKFRTDLNAFEKVFCSRINNQNHLFFIESNAAHHLSYFLAKKYLNLEENPSTSRKKLVINFDRHTDTNASNYAKALACGNWGYWLYELYNCDYLAIGAPGESTKNSFDHGFLYIKDGNKNDKYDTTYKEYEKLYVTVDMDVLKNESNIQRTNWEGGGKVDFESLKIYLNKLPHGKIVAADITGFPPYVNNEDAILSRYTNDIKQIADILTQKIIT